MKQRPERIIKIEDPLSMKKQFQTIAEQQKSGRVKFVDSEIFTYPLMLREFVDKALPDEILFEGELMKYMPGFKY
jgi:hypothetical protein